MSDRALHGKTFGLTLLSPILPDARTISPKAALTRYLASIPTGAESPLARVSTTHLARWTVISAPPYEGFPATPDHFKSAYLLFTSNFDGDLDPYLDLLADAIPETVAGVWQHCIGFPGLADRTAFRRYMHRCHIETALVFSGYPNATVEEVLRALMTQRALIDFIRANRAASPAELQRAFVEWTHRLNGPAPPPGTL
jgi:hypothetical protein